MQKKIVGMFVAIFAIIVVSIVSIQVFSKREAIKVIDVAIGEKIAAEKIEGTALPTSIQYTNAIVDAIEYQIISVNEENNTALVSFTYVDAIGLADKYGESVENIEGFYTYCVDTISCGEAPFITKEIEVQYDVDESRKENKCLIRNSPDLADALTGGTYSAYIQLLGGE